MNTTQLIQALQENPILPAYKSSSLNITSMYSNIPITETRHILNYIMKFNLIDSHTKEEILIWYDTITKQNYFMNKNNIIIQNDGLAMGAPTSGIL